MAPRGWGLGGNTSYNGLNGEAPPARGIFFRLHKVYERVGISLVLDERVGKSVISVARRPKGTNRYISCLWKSRENFLALWYINISKTVDLQQLKGMPSSKLGMWKRYLLSIEGMKGWSFLSKMVCKGVRGCRSLPRYKTFLSNPPPRGLWQRQPLYQRYRMSPCPPVKLFRAKRKKSRNPRSLLLELYFKNSRMTPFELRFARWRCDLYHVHCDDERVLGVIMW